MAKKRVSKNQPGSSGRASDEKLKKAGAELEAKETAAKVKGYSSLDELIEAAPSVATEACSKPRRKHPQPFEDINNLPGLTGKAFHGDSLGLLHHPDYKDKFDLIMTSPPFALRRKKAYGNETAKEYVNWFRPFAEGFKEALKDSGSLVIDIGGAWNPGEPTRSLYHFEMLLSLVNEHGFKLCQEFYWLNPAKLPSPTEWVNVRRVRVKDAVNCIWWLSKTGYPKVSNRRVLAPYSPSMEYLLKRQKYNSGGRPSEHQVGKKSFLAKHAGAVPPNMMAFDFELPEELEELREKSAGLEPELFEVSSNLIAIANTESNSAYQKYLKSKGSGLIPHPARFPYGLPDFFIRMLTDKDDQVLDPFAGSCVTGEVAQALGRKWVCCELGKIYLEGAVGRFSPLPKERIVPRDKTYKIYAPQVKLSDEQAPLAQDGGKERPEASVTRTKKKGKKKPGGRKAVKKVSAKRKSTKSKGQK